MTADVGIQPLQEFAYAPGYDYRNGAPHLKHPQLYDWLTASLRQEVRRLKTAGLPTDVLEIGAGDGAFVEPLRRPGATVRATEMSRPSIHMLCERFGMNPSFDVEFDPDGTMRGLGEKRYAMILYASVLHHIPDYLAALTTACDRHLLPGGDAAHISGSDLVCVTSPRRPRHRRGDVPELAARTRGPAPRHLVAFTENA